MLEPAPGDSGFTVDPATLGGVAGQIGKAYDALNTAITQYGGSSANPGDFGTEVSSAWSNLDGAWAQELNVLGLAVQEMIGKVSSAAGGYAGADSSVAKAVGTIAG